MEKGILYVMTSAIQGVVKIGSTQHFEMRMGKLERDGYRNVTGLKRTFAIEVDNYDNKEQMLFDVFSGSRISNSELFAVDVDLVIQLLSSFKGKKIYPPDETVQEVFEDATMERDLDRNTGIIPDGIYYLKEGRRGFGQVFGTMRVKDGQLWVQKGSTCGPTRNTGYIPKARRTARIVNGTLQEDVLCDTPSAAGWVVTGRSSNGWEEWKDQNGQPIDIYRNAEESPDPDTAS